jgi:hypothetical protein
MRWQKGKLLQVGDKRYVTYFAFFPTTLTNNHVVWLERYNGLEEFHMEGKDWETAHWKTVKTWFFEDKEVDL